MGKEAGLCLNEFPFVSISGEGGGFAQGSLCTFVRLQGCNLRCKYCDTKRSQLSVKKDSITFSVKELIIVIEQKGVPRVLITGGEPLMQGKSVTILIEELLQRGYEIQVETNGSITPPLIGTPGKIYWVIDRKGPSSGSTKHMLTPIVQNYGWDHNTIFFKYVLAGTDSPHYQADRKFASGDMKALDTAGFRGCFLLSPKDARVSDLGSLFFFPDYLRPRIIFSLQLHKILGVA